MYRQGQKYRQKHETKRLFEFHNHVNALTMIHINCRRQCGPVVRALALRSGDPGFKTHSEYCLILFLVDHGSTSQLHL